ncbi:MAG: hypothetical protein U1E65_06045 [Myxococcota bacterium]
MWLNPGYGFGNPWLYGMPMAAAAAPLAAAAVTAACMPYAPMYAARASAWSMFAGAGLASFGMMSGYGLGTMLWNNTPLYGGWGGSGLGAWGAALGLGYGWGGGLWF